MCNYKMQPEGKGPAQNKHHPKKGSLKGLLICEESLLSSNSDNCLSSGFPLTIGTSLMKWLVSNWLTLLEIRHTGAARGLRNRASVLFPEKKVWKFDSVSLRKGGFDYFSLQCPAQPTSFQIRGGSCLWATVAPPHQIRHADWWVTFIPPFLWHQVCFR